MASLSIYFALGQKLILRKISTAVGGVFKKIFLCLV